MTNKRYLPLKDHKGIRKEIATGNFQVRKKIDGRTYTETFQKISQALKWRSNFHPLLTKTEVKRRGEVSPLSFNNVDQIISRPNGVDNRFTFEEIWELYREQYLPSIEKQSATDAVKRASNLFPEFYKYKMTQINAELIDVIIRIKVQEYKNGSKANTKRFSFDKELQTLRALLNWYRENYDVMFVVPILKRHFISGIVKHKVLGKKKKMTPEQVYSFFSAFDLELYLDFAKIHFYMAGRVQEPAGLQWENVDLNNAVLTVTDVVVWGYKKRFEYLKEIPKNGEERLVHLNEEMITIFKRRLLDMKEGVCRHFRKSSGERLNFVFHIEGEPLTFRQIQYRYNKALKAVGLFPEFSATHILRKAMANIVRQAMGLEAAQAVGGWKSREIVEKIYTDNAPSELNQQAVDTVQKIMEKCRTERLIKTN